MSGHQYEIYEKSLVISVFCESPASKSPKLPNEFYEFRGLTIPNEFQTFHIKWPQI